jgi:hypothetical protein
VKLDHQLYSTTKVERMKPLTLKQRQPVEEPEIEDWDDGDFANLDEHSAASCIHDNIDCIRQAISQRFGVFAIIDTIRLQPRRRQLGHPRW